MKMNGEAIRAASMPNRLTMAKVRTPRSLCDHSRSKPTRRPIPRDSSSLVAISMGGNEENVSCMGAYASMRSTTFNDPHQHSAKSTRIKYECGTQRYLNACGRSGETLNYRRNKYPFRHEWTIAQLLQVLENTEMVVCQVATKRSFARRSHFFGNAKTTYAFGGGTLGVSRLPPRFTPSPAAAQNAMYSRPSIS
jgi:hypothetical protein